MKKVCFAIDALNLPIIEVAPDAKRWIIRLTQTGIDRFTVEYGAERHDNLNYRAAAAKLGAMVMHALACEGKLDNSERRASCLSISPNNR